jgi:DNA-binding XRE family transcriptional regulator
MTFGGAAALLEGVPRRPSQDDPKRVAAWERRRKTIGSRVRQLREEQGLTLDDLALTSGLSRNTLWDLELGNRGLLYERLFDVALALGVPLADLVEDVR